MPFMSRYRLSNSSPLGLGPLVSMGISCPSISRGCSSMTRYEVRTGHERLRAARQLTSGNDFRILLAEPAEKG